MKVSKVSLDDFEIVTTELFCTQDPAISPHLSPRDEAVEILIRITLILTGEVYQPGYVFPEPKHPKNLSDVRKNLLIVIANELSKNIEAHIYDLEKSIQRVYSLVDSIYPVEEKDLDVMDLRFEDDDVS
jgi:hypothetical protein